MIVNIVCFFQSNNQQFMSNQQYHKSSIIKQWCAGKAISLLYNMELLDIHNGISPTQKIKLEAEETYNMKWPNNYIVHLYSICIYESAILN